MYTFDKEIPLLSKIRTYETFLHKNARVFGILRPTVEILNPTRTKVQMQFDEPLIGNFTVDIINLSGQIIHWRSLSLRENAYLSFELASAPPAGVYYLRAKEQNENKTYAGQLIIR